MIEKIENQIPPESALKKDVSKKKTPSPEKNELTALQELVFFTVNSAGKLSIITLKSRNVRLNPVNKALEYKAEHSDKYIDLPGVDINLTLKFADRYEKAREAGDQKKMAQIYEEAGKIIKERPAGRRLKKEKSPPEERPAREAGRERAIRPDDLLEKIKNTGLSEQIEIASRVRQEVATRIENGHYLAALVKTKKIDQDTARKLALKHLNNLDDLLDKFYKRAKKNRPDGDLMRSIISKTIDSEQLVFGPVPPQGRSNELKALLFEPEVWRQIINEQEEEKKAASYFEKAAAEIEAIDKEGVKEIPARKLFAKLLADIDIKRSTAQLPGEAVNRGVPVKGVRLDQNKSRTNSLGIEETQKFVAQVIKEQEKITREKAGIVSTLKKLAEENKSQKAAAAILNWAIAGNKVDGDILRAVELAGVTAAQIEEAIDARSGGPPDLSKRIPPEKQRAYALMMRMTILEGKRKAGRLSMRDLQIRQQKASWTDGLAQLLSGGIKSVDLEKYALKMGKLSLAALTAYEKTFGSALPSPGQAPVGRSINRLKKRLRAIPGGEHVLSDQEINRLSGQLRDKIREYDRAADELVADFSKRLARVASMSYLDKFVVGSIKKVLDSLGKSFITSSDQDIQKASEVNGVVANADDKQLVNLAEQAKKVPASSPGHKAEVFEGSTVGRLIGIVAEYNIKQGKNPRLSEIYKEAARLAKKNNLSFLPGGMRGAQTSQLWSGKIIDL